MKKYLLIAALFCACPLSAQDCTKAIEACSSDSKQVSPFVQASIGERLPPAPAAARKSKAVMRPAPASAKVPAVSSAPAAQPEPAAAPQSAGRGLSSPLWLFFIGGGLAGLYLYLSGTRRKGRRR